MEGRSNTKRRKVFIEIHATFLLRKNLSILMYLFQNDAHCGKVVQEKGEVEDGITIEDLLYALQETRPSVSRRELQKYHRM